MRPAATPTGQRFERSNDDRRRPNAACARQGCSIDEAGRVLRRDLKRVARATRRVRPWEADPIRTGHQANETMDAKVAHGFRPCAIPRHADHAAKHNCSNALPSSKRRALGNGKRRAHRCQEHAKFENPSLHLAIGRDHATQRRSAVVRMDRAASLPCRNRQRSARSRIEIAAEHGGGPNERKRQPAHRTRRRAKPWSLRTPLTGSRSHPSVRLRHSCRRRLQNLNYRLERWITSINSDTFFCRSAASPLAIACCTQ